MAAYTCIESLSKNYHFSDSLCFDFAKHERPKVPIRKLSSSWSTKTEVHAPGFRAFAWQTLLNARCRAAAVLRKNKLYRQTETEA